VIVSASFSAFDWRTAMSPSIHLARPTTGSLVSRLSPAMSAPWIDPEERAEMAWQCATIEDAPVPHDVWMKIVAGVAQQAAAAERERCANLLESHESPYDNTAHYYARIIHENEQPA
jgi:hypothetical protein